VTLAIVAALTLSDGIAPAALVVAVLAAILAGPAVRGASRRREIADLRAALRDAEDRLEALAAVTGRGFASTLSAFDFEGGLLERMLSGRMSEADADGLLRTHREMRRGVERAWAEANLLSADPAARRSAQEQLNGRLADEHSAEVIRLSGKRQRER